MVTKQGFFQKWFPTFANLFVKGTPELATTEQSSPPRLNPRRSPHAPFFIQGLEALELTESFGRDQLLEQLGWVNVSTPEPLYSPAIAPPEIVTPEVPSPVIPVETVAEPLPTVIAEDPHFFIQGLAQVSNIEQFKNIELWSLLAWEEEGQTLLEVDPDDYGLLDDLLDVAEV